MAQIPEAPGKLVDIGGRSLHLHCTGSGEPAVILEAGFPGSSLDWMRVQPDVSKTTTVCSYDRAGLGWSDPGAGTRSGIEIVEDLHKLLRAAAVKPPYVLAGHSLGGLYVRIFAARRPEEVIGIVLVDATHEDQWDFAAKVPWTAKDPQAAKHPPQPPVTRTPEADKILGQMWRTDKWKTAERLEREGIKYTIAEMQKQPKRLPVVPLIVLSAGPGLDALSNAKPDAWKGQLLHREMAAFSPLGEWIPVPGANHYIHTSQPAAVVDAIGRVVTTARTLKPANSTPQ